MLSKGDVGPAVKYLQAALNIHMFDCPDPLVVDGKFGPLTEARTALFQGRYDLLVDAIVGPLTTDALCTYMVSEQHLILGHSQTNRRGPYDVATHQANPGIAAALSVPDLADNNA